MDTFEGYAVEGFHGRGMELVYVTAVFTVIAIALVLARVGARLTTGRKLYLDDYFIVISAGFAVGLAATNCVGVYYGYGSAAATLSSHDQREALRMFWACQLLYKLTINCTKVSILLLYLRVFAASNTMSTIFRRAVYVVLFFVSGYAIASFFVTAFQCIPITRTLDKSVEGTCINLTAFWVANAVANIGSDLVICGLPVQVIWKLHMPRNQKLALVLVFALGLFVCITSIFRVTTLQPSSTSPDQIYGTLISTIWTTIEANTGIICACLPMLKKPLTMLFPRLFPRGSYHSAGYLPSNNATTPRRNSKFIWRTGWFRLGRDRRSTPAISPPVGFDPPPRDTFRDDTPESFLFSLGQNATPLQAMPSGRITRTTDVEVQFGAGADERVSSSESSAAPIKKDPGFPRAHLGGRNRMFR